MKCDKDLFWQLFDDEKAKGLGDLAAMSSACDSIIFMKLKLQSAADAEFEVIPPLMISDKNDEAG